MVRPRKKKDDVIVVKKYANRRLYDTGRSSYVTLDDLCDMIKEGQEFVVQDAKTGEDLTQQVLTQIIVEQEGRGQTMLPPNFLKQLIGFYGDNMQSVLPNYLEGAMQSFVHNQEALRDSMSKSMSGMMPNMPGLQGTVFDDLNRKNMDMFRETMQQTMNMMSQSLRMFGAKEAGSAAPSHKPAKAMSKDERIRHIKQTITELQEELRGLI